MNVSTHASASPVPGMFSFSVISEEESTEENPPALADSNANQPSTNQPSTVKPTHAGEIQLASKITSAAENTDISNLIANLSMIGTDSVASSEDEDEGEDEEQKKFQDMLDDTVIEDDDDDTMYQRHIQHIRSDVSEVNARTKKMDERQEKMDKRQEKMAEDQGKMMEGQGELKGGQKQILENQRKLLAHQAENGPTYKTRLEKSENERRKETAGRKRAEKEANSLRELLEKERNAKAQRNRKPPAILSDQTNAEKEAEANHQVRLQPETQKKAAATRSVRGPMGRGRR